jgi:hypothetical protein
MAEEEISAISTGKYPKKPRQMTGRNRREIYNMQGKTSEKMREIIHRRTSDRV